MTQVKLAATDTRNQAPIPRNLVLRPLQPGDASPIFAIISNSFEGFGGFWLPHEEPQKIQDWTAKREPGQYRLVAELNDSIVAVAWLNHFTRPRISHTGQIGLIVQSGQGSHQIGATIAQEILNLADDWLNLKRIEAIVKTSDEEDKRSLETLGFTVEGTYRESLFGDGHWQDEYLFARLRGFDSSIDKRKSHDAGEIESPAEREMIRFRDLAIRPIHPDDVNELYEIFRRPEVCRTTIQLPSQEIAMTEERVHNPPPGIHRLVAIADGQLVGSISVKQRQNPQRSHTAGLGMMVHPDFWGQGIGTRLMESIIDLADNWLNLKRVELDVNVDNPAGIRLYEKFGFAIEGTKRFHIYGDGRWVDSYFMARLK